MILFLNVYRLNGEYFKMAAGKATEANLGCAICSPCELDVIATWEKSLHPVAASRRRLLTRLSSRLPEPGQSARPCHSDKKSFSRRCGGHSAVL